MLDLTGFTKSFAGLLVARLFLGLCEGVLLGGMVCYLAFFYRRDETGYRIGLFYSAAPFSGAFRGHLASGLSQIDCGSCNRWPWIFVSFGSQTNTR